MTLRRVLLVFLGGALGTAARLALALLIPDAGGFPVATFIVNIVGALLIGVVAARLPFDRLRGREGGLRGRDAGLRGREANLRVFFGAGILGGFTTYSAFAAGTFTLWADMPLLAGGYALASLILGVAAAAFGMRLGRRHAQ